jgi:hypothetical protein
MKSLPPLSSSNIRNTDQDGSSPGHISVRNNLKSDLISSLKESPIAINLMEGIVTSIVVQSQKANRQHRDEGESIETAIQQNHMQLGADENTGINSIRRVESENSLIFACLEDESSPQCDSHFSSEDSMAYSYSSSSDNEDDDEGDDEEDEPYDAKMTMIYDYPLHIMIRMDQSIKSTHPVKRDRISLGEDKNSVRGASSNLEDNTSIISTSWRDHFATKRKLNNDEDEDDDSLGPGRIVPSNNDRRRWMAKRSAGRQ